ncbi:hypothetical protein COPCOM_01718 [Coprococcus comes ATCC 27758]|uniref:Uncharacterized protein n=1 Tax=Coprococcus comes ATCC 27758 TaxID=470146 RepID=C0B992_9FIRM|nr:hypothetical protein COPCOM_01718 [Coprococcus comes ATCC 27758]
MPGGDEPGEREELVKRNTRQLYLMFFCFCDNHSSIFLPAAGMV